ncbi:hypothetical protein OROMI_024986 [Orobanche minor]
MPSRGGSYRRSSRSNRQHPQVDKNWTLRPILDHHTSTEEAPSSSASIPEDQSHPQDLRNLTWTPKNRGRKPRSPRKSHLKQGDSASTSGSGSKLNSDFNSDDVNGEKNGCDDELGAGLNLGHDSGEIQELGAQSEEGNQKGGWLKSSNEEDEDETVRRLEELRLSGEEPELSEEQLSINKQLQEDELLAVASIFEDKIFILEDQSSLKCFQAHIHVEVHKGFPVTAKLKSSTFHDNNAEGSSDFSYSFQVEYLPPIILTCLLPKSYPIKSSPHFTIYVPWLGSDKVSDLCCKLDSIWQEQAGQEVIYQWLEWLHGCTLSYLGFDTEIVLGPYGMRQNGDRRAISGSISPDIDIPKIKSYNDEERHENFCRNIQECPICFCEFVGSEFIRLPCQHFFCAKCLKTLADIHIMEGTVQKIKCPEAKCGGMIPPGLLKRVLGQEDFERWESLTLRKTLDSMTDVVYCPRCEMACLEDEDNHAQCSKCYYSFCTLCMERRHVGVACLTPELKLAILQDRQNSSLMKGEQRKREADMINQILSMKEINRFAKQCPTCKMAISRTEGCNKMHCENCGQYFCYICNQTISGYEHFREGSCELFPKEEIQRWQERMMDDRQLGQERAQRLAEGGGHRHPCPLCGQENTK